MTPVEANPVRRYDGRLQCVVVTPETTVLDTAATFVALPLFDGEIGIAPLHSPMIGRLGFGEMRVVEETGTRVYYVDGGFVQVADNCVTVLTVRAMAATEVDPEEMAEQLAGLRARPAHGRQQMAIRDRQIARVRSQLRTARRAHSEPIPEPSWRRPAAGKA